MDLKALGKTVPSPVEGADPALLETLVFAHDAASFAIELVCDEFTALCEVTGQPDFGTVTISYEPAGRIVESKSLKLYLQSYRMERLFHERVINKICRDLVRALAPRQITVRGVFKSRGGIAICPIAQWVYVKEEELKKAYGGKNS